MTAREMIPAIGQIVALRSGSLKIECKVLDVKNSYGKTRLLISPVCGDGEQWVEMSSLVVGYARPGWISVEAITA